MFPKCVPGNLRSFHRLVQMRKASSSTFQAVLRQLSKDEVSSSPPPSYQISVEKGSMDQRSVIREIVNEDSSAQEDSSVCPPDACEIRRDISDTIGTLLDAQSIWDPERDPTKASLQDESLTPAQRFYLENRELLIKRAAEYSATKAAREWETISKDVEDDWRFYRDPVVRPEKGKLWPISPDEGTDDTSSASSGFAGSTTFPSIEEIVNMLRSEHVEDICPIDLELAGRRDIGEYALIGTVRSHAHGDRVARIARKAVQSLNLENIACFSNAAPGQEWIVVRLGPVVVHLMTGADRERYHLEDLYFIASSSFDEDVLNPRNDSIATDGATLRLNSNS